MPTPGGLQFLYGLDLPPCWLVGDFVAFIEAGDVVDAALLKIDSAVLASVDMSAEHNPRTLL